VKNCRYRYCYLLAELRWNYETLCKYVNNAPTFTFCKTNFVPKLISHWYDYREYLGVGIKNKKNNKKEAVNVSCRLFHKI